MKNLTFIISILIILLVSCTNEKNSNKSEEINSEAPKKEFVKIKATEIPDNIIKLISEDWMLITAGTNNSFNTMTASWGALGEVWGKNASFITVRDSRYTYEFLESNEYYTLSFFTEDYRNALSICGSKSGRDTDKIKEAGLTPKELESGNMSFEEARLIIECKKLYAEPFKKDSFTDSNTFDDIYNNDPSIHTLYIGEIVNVLIKQ